MAKTTRKSRTLNAPGKSFYFQWTRQHISLSSPSHSADRRSIAMIYGFNLLAHEALCYSRYINFISKLFSCFLFSQDRHIPAHSKNGEPWLDPSQDYVLLLGSENATHTILRFRRRMRTCDEKYDVSITVSWVISSGSDGLRTRREITRFGIYSACVLCCVRAGTQSFPIFNIFYSHAAAALLVEIFCKQCSHIHM